jgi:hypothetical protein
MGYATNITIGVLVTLALIGLFIGLIAGLGNKLPTVSVGADTGIIIFSGVTAGITLILFGVGLYLQSKKATVVGVTELSFISKVSGWLTSILVSYLPMALLWLGPILALLLLDVSFILPSFLAFIPFMIISTIDKAFNQGAIY